ncbi:MAG: NAD-binding protein [Chloroflexi bacterium]|nr:NAD-binding protein [Chloroflexota bacterium]
MDRLSHVIRDLRAFFYSLPPNILRSVAVIVSLAAIGTIGYMVLEGWTFLDALYMTVIVLTTIGFAEVRELDDVGRIFTIVLAVTGIGAIFYALVAVFQFLMEGELASILGSQRMARQIEHLRDHYILCGFGRFGQEIAREFKEHDVDFVVVETDQEAIALGNRRGYFMLVGDATSDQVLTEAGIARAVCLVAAAGSDAGNTFIVLAANSLNPDLYIVARASQAESLPRMTRAGAQRVFSPYAIVGRQMALAAMQPLVAEFIDTPAAAGGEQGVLAEIEVSEKTGAHGSLGDLLGGLRDISVLGVQKKNGKLTVSPAMNTQLLEGDRVIVIASEDALSRIRPASKATV